MTSTMSGLYFGGILDDLYTSLTARPPVTLGLHYTPARGMHFAVSFHPVSICTSQDPFMR